MNLATTIGFTYLGLQVATLICISIGGYRYVGQTWPVMQPQTVADSSNSFIKFWWKTVWKMRSVYSSFLVHAFDIATDLIVIIEWLTEEDKEHVDSKLMAYFSISIIVFHKIISSFAIWIVEISIQPP